MLEVEKKVYGDTIDKKALAEYYWGKFEDVPVVMEDNFFTVTDVPFLHFEKGTLVETIWHWFEEEFGVSVVELMDA